MATVADILAYLDTIAPPAMAEDWDHVGLNCGHLHAQVKKILVALDPFSHVCQEAKEVGADLLVTHHALIWDPGFITDGDIQGKNTLFLIENGIAAINAHTNLDQAPGGVNDVLARKLGLANISVIAPRGSDTEGREWGLLRKGEAEEQSLTSFLSTVKASLGCKGLRYADGGKPVHWVAVGGGSCASEMQDAIKAGCDTFVTSDIKYNQFWDAHDLGLNLIDAGHFYTENPVTEYLARQLQEAFPDMEVTLSRTHRDVMEFF